MTTTTVRDVITKALQKNGVLTQGQAPTAGEASDAFDALVDMMDLWALDSLLCFAKTTETFILTDNTSTYNIGSGQTFNTSIPTVITSAFVRDVTTDYEVAIISDDEYNKITQDKTIVGMPISVAFTQSYPIAKLRFFPVPTKSYSFVMTSEKPISSFTSLDQVISLPPGWKQTLVYNLGLALAADYNTQMPATLPAIAAESKAALKRMVARNRGMDSDIPSMAKPNVYIG